MNTSFENDIPLDLATRAHYGTSFVPEDRGSQERASYATTLRNDFDVLSKLANTTEKSSILTTEFDWYREGYRARYIAMLSSKSRCLSSMIAGPLNFPTRRAQKANDSANNRTQELIEYRERALAAIRKTLQPELAPIMLGDSDAGDRIASKLETLKQKRDLMKACNSAIRKYSKEGESAQIAALVSLGLTDKTAQSLLKPDYMGRIGFPSFELTNLGAEIRRLEKRASVVVENQSKPATVCEGANVRMEEAPSENRVRLFFSGKPDVETRTELKRRGFRWSPTIGCWQAYLNTNSVAFAREWLTK